MKNSAIFPLLSLALALPTACGDDTSGTGGSSDDGGSTGTGSVDVTTDSPMGTTSDEEATSQGSTDDGEETTDTTGEPPAAPSVPGLIKELVAMEDAGTDVEGFPLEYVAGNVDVRVIPQLESRTLTSFLEPLSDETGPEGPVWGSNNDFIAYLGDGWEEDGSPYFSGSGEAGWMWTNFEYISNGRPSEGAAPVGVALQLATWLLNQGVPEFQFGVDDSAEWTAERVDAYITWHKRMVGGALYRVERGADGWAIDTSADNVRFDASSDTLFRITGPISIEPALDDEGNELPANVVPGTSSNCSGGVTPWGTFVSAEENTQFGYGDLEACWTSSNVFVPGGPCDDGSAIEWDTTPNPNSDFTRGTATNTRPNYYGYLVEIDPSAPSDRAYDAATGEGHQKLGSMGRARWENVTFHVGPDWALVPDQPIVFYSGNDRRGGRIYKWVSNGNYTEGMTRAEIRNLLADGSTYVAHFEDLDNSDDDAGAEGGLTVGGSLPTAATPGQGRWIRLSVDNQEDLAPNAAALGPATTVGEALGDNDWNELGGFANDETVLMGLFTAATKIGVRELNRPEDLEFNPVDGNVWIAFTNHGRANALRDDGTLNLDDPETKADEHDDFVRGDRDGAIFVLTEADSGNPGDSDTFTFYAAWRGSAEGTTFTATDPDNLAIDSEGGIWFGTDGNFSEQTQDAIYYLQVAEEPTESRAWRVASVPSDAEATGPSFSSDEHSLFFNVQHPHEDLDDSPDTDFEAFGELGPRSGQVVLTPVP
ncbi:MAG: alkaline phosphatase PhoX [Myxococcota bacterium]